MSANTGPGSSPPDLSALPEVLPVHEPVVTRKPPEGRKFPCKRCGARLDFDPSSRALKCPYCGFVEEIEPDQDGVQEQDWEAFWEQRAGKETVLAGHSSEVKCPGCGAVVLLDDKVATDRCPYCATHLENQPVAAHAMIPPEGVLPFHVSQRDAVSAYNGWIASRWFAPTGLRQFANLGRLAGVYVPFWTFDSMTYSRYAGQRGDDYTVRETYTETDASGQQVTKTRNVTRTRWTRVRGEVQHFFDDVLICASRGLPEDLATGLAPWDLPKLEGFRDDYLSGFQTERYGIGLREGFGKAQGVMDAHIRHLCAQDIGGDHQRVESVKTQHVGIAFKHLLLPVWMAAYRYHDRTFRILVNGRSGQVVGTRPYSWVKIAALIVVIVLAILAFVLIASRAGGAEPHDRHTSCAFPTVGCVKCSADAPGLGNGASALRLTHPTLTPFRRDVWYAGGFVAGLGPGGCNATNPGPQERGMG